MVAFRIDFSRIQQLDANSAVLSGAKLHVFQNETVTPVTLYSDRDGLNTAANPIVADSAGRFPVRYVADDDLLTLDLDTANDVDVWSDNDIEPVPNVDNAALANYMPLTGGQIGPLDFTEGAAVASAATVNLDRANVTGNLIHITGTTGISAVTLAQGAFRWVVFDGALTLTHSSNLLLPGSANITTVAGDRALLVGEGSGVTRCMWFILGDGKPLIENAEIQLGLGTETTTLTTGTGKITFRMPYAMTLDALPRASLTTAQASGTVVTVDINEAGSSILSTKLTIDNSETTSETAATPAVLSDTALADNAVITVDIDAVDGATAAAGLKILLRGYRRNRS